MDLFCCDLDNTLIYSWRRQLSGEKFCVEWLDGREISYITRRALGLLKELEKRMLLIPVTTRRVEQYQRIILPGVCPVYALVCNGGVLLEKGEEAEDWYKDSLDRIKDSQGELNVGQRILEGDTCRDFEVWRIRELFLFTKSRDPEKTVKELKKRLDLQKIDVFTNKNKVYVIPKALNKGAALERIKDRLGAKRVFAAGDSLFDMPMLARADLAYRGGEEPFAEEMLEYFLSRSRRRDIAAKQRGR